MCLDFAAMEGERKTVIYYRGEMTKVTIDSLSVLRSNVFVRYDNRMTD